MPNKKEIVEEEVKKTKKTTAKKEVEPRVAAPQRSSRPVVLRVLWRSGGKQSTQQRASRRVWLRHSAAADPLCSVCCVVQVENNRRSNVPAAVCGCATTRRQTRCAPFLISFE